jgi:F-type H+-transporting ATPase subunit epsilon
VPGSFSLEIVTPERLVYEGEVTALQAPGLDGLFGILYNRAPLLSALGSGPIKLTELEGGTRYVAISGGFFQIVNNQAVVLADQAELGEEIDLTEAEARLEQARQHLAGLVPSEDEMERRREAIKRAAVRVKVASQVHR